MLNRRPYGLRVNRVSSGIRTAASWGLVVTLVLCCGSLVAAQGVDAANAAPEKDANPSPPPPPEPMREFRGVWVASVANIDWPSEPGLTTGEAKRELVAILDRAKALNLNAVVLQVRPTGDAMYRSELEPWSEWLTGEIGLAPAPMWDPLAFAIEQAHNRGLELHAWFNPFRALHPSNVTDPAAPALAATQPELVKRYGSYLWMDPGEPAVRQHTLEVILDVVERYDLDGVHLDDYFYPYPIPAPNDRVADRHGNLPFPDEASWARYRDAGGELSRPNWRRNNVNTFVENLYQQVKSRKPQVKLGISPFGVYRPGRPAYVTGFDQYDQLYADPLHWLEEGWIDYLSPQLYWPIARPQQSFTALLRWWVDHNPLGRHLWPGIAVYRHFSSPDTYPVREFVYQVQWTRHLTRVSAGHIMFSMRWLMPGDDRGPLAAGLARGAYATPALVPESPWLFEGDPPPAPSVGPVRVSRDAVRVTLAVDDAPTGTHWVVQVRRNAAWHTAIAPASHTAVTVPTPAGGVIDAVTARRTDRFGRLSPPAHHVP